MPATAWIPVRLIKPHPNNPRHANRSERFAAIVESMRSSGFWPDKPLVVRPIGPEYEAIGGNTRLKAAVVAGLDEVFCSIQPMTDREAIIRLAEDNLGDPFNWAEMCIYVAENAIKDDRNGLSRVRLVQACTGITGASAENAAKRWGRSGELIQQLIAEQSVYLDGVINSKKDLNRHLYEISILPDYSDREYLVGRLLSETLTIEQVRAIVDSIRRSRQASPPIDIPPAPIPKIAPTQSSPAVTLPRLIEAPSPRSVTPEPKRKIKPDYSPIDILAMELEAANDRVDKLERLVYGLFNTFGSTVPDRYVAEANRLGVFAFRFKEQRHAG